MSGASSRLEYQKDGVGFLTTRCTDIDLTRPADDILMFQMLDFSSEYWEKSHGDYTLFREVSDAVKQYDNMTHLDGANMLFPQFRIP